MDLKLSRAVSVGLIIALASTGAPLLAQQSSSEQTAPATESSRPGIELPDSPGSLSTSTNPQAPVDSGTQSAPQQQTPNQSPQSRTSSQPGSQPSGTAVAPSVQTSGGAASKPAGVAIAPPKQRQVRSWLIKFGFIAGAGAALGTVAALSAGSPGRVPGSH